MSRTIIINDADPNAAETLHILAPKMAPDVLWVDGVGETDDVGIAMNLDREGATKLRDFLTEWLDTTADNG